MLTLSLLLCVLAIANANDDYLNVTQIIVENGYPCEDHSVTTKDGFILSLQRIPHGRSNFKSSGPRPVVYMMHGFLDESTTWVINSPEESLGYILADQGYDVWLGNSRGNVYSRQNIYYTPDQNQFWAWSWDDMAHYDLPAIFAYIAKETGVPTFSYVGHSQGTTQFFAAISSNPSLSQYINLFVALAPVAFFDNQDSLAVTVFSDLPEFLVWDIFGVQAFPTDNTIVTILEQFFPEVCGITPWICENVIFIIGGCNSAGQCDPGNLNQTRVPVYSGHIGGASVQDLMHFLQNSKLSTFSMYNFGTSGNQQHYNSSTPPVYNLANFKVPTAIFYGGLDNFADPTDVERLLGTLTTIEFSHEEPTYEHLDFIWGMDAHQKIYPSVVTLLQKYNPTA